MTIDLSPVIAVLATALLGASTTAISVGTRALLARFAVANAADLANKVDTIASAAAGEAYRQAVLHGHDLTIPGGQNAAIAIGANYLLARAPDALRQLGVTPEHVDGLVAARIGKLLAADPTVSGGRQGLATPPATAEAATPNAGAHPPA